MEEQKESLLELKEESKADVSNTQIKFGLDLSRENVGKIYDSLLVDFEGSFSSQELDFMKKNRDDIINNIVINGSNQFTPITFGVVPGASVSKPNVTPCQKATVVAIVAFVMLVLGLVGIHEMNEENLTRELLRELGEDTLNGFSRLIQAFADADGAPAKAKAAYDILSQIFSGSTRNAIFKTLKDQMHWYDWLKFSILLTAQLVAWFASDGVAFIAEMILVIPSAVGLATASYDVVTTCFGDDGKTPVKNHWKPEVHDTNKIRVSTTISSYNQSSYDISLSTNYIEWDKYGWAYGSSSNLPATGVYGFNPTLKQKIYGIQMITGNLRSDLHVCEFELYATSGYPSLAAQATPVTNMKAVNTINGLDIKFNRLTCTGQVYVELRFDPILATGLKIVIYNGDYSSGNSVLSELYILGSAVEQIASGHDPRKARIVGASSSHDQSSYPIAMSYDGNEWDKRDGWAYGGNVPATGVWQFKEEITITRLQILNGVNWGNTLHMNDFELYYTTTPSPTLSSNFIPMEDIKSMNSVEDVDVQDNHVTCSGQVFYELSFKPVLATGIRLVINGSDDSGNNTVLNQITVFGTTDSDGIVDKIPILENVNAQKMEVL